MPKRNLKRVIQEYRSRCMDKYIYIYQEQDNSDIVGCKRQLLDAYQEFKDILDDIANVCEQRGRY